MCSEQLREQLHAQLREQLHAQVRQQLQSVTDKAEHVHGLSKHFHFVSIDVV